MKHRVEIHQIKRCHKYYSICLELCQNSTKLYNQANQDNIDSFNHSGLISHYALGDKHYKKFSEYNKLPAKVSQLVIKQVYDNWQSYFAGIKKYNESKVGFTGRPRFPKNLDKLNLVKFNNQAFSHKQFIENKIIKLSKTPIEIPAKPNSKPEDIAEIRIIPKLNTFNIEVVYQYEDGYIKETESNLAAAIDIGVNNLATITFNDLSIAPLKVNGKVIKSCNQWMNKEVARLKSISNKLTTIKIQNIITNRNNQIRTKLHEASSMISDLFVKLNIQVVAIGKNIQWKTSSKMSSKSNQNFIQIPHATFIEQLTYKLEDVGIKVVIGEESYTSKASFLDWDTIPTYGDKSEKVFSGKRTRTKEYKSKNGTIINADENGSYNIGRKVIPNFFSCLEQVVKRDSGCVIAHPMAIELALND